MANRQKSKQRFIIIDPKRIHFLETEADPLANLQAERRPELLPWFYTYRISDVFVQWASTSGRKNSISQTCNLRFAIQA